MKIILSPLSDIILSYHDFLKNHKKNKEDFLKFYLRNEYSIYFFCCPCEAWFCGLPAG